MHQYQCGSEGGGPHDVSNMEALQNQQVQQSASCAIQKYQDLVQYEEEAFTTQANKRPKHRHE